MSQNNELAKVKAKILALSNKTIDKGCTEAEMLSAFEKIGDLLTQYNLEMSEIDIREEPCIKKTFTTIFKIASPVYPSLTSIARFCDCRVWVTKGHGAKGEMGYHFFGLESDVEMALYLTETIEKAILHETFLYSKTSEYKNSRSRTSANISFKKGMSWRIAARLSEMKTAQDAEIAKKNIERGVLLGSNVKSLVLVKENIVNEEFKKLGLRLTKRASGRTVGTRSAFDSGTVAGNKVNLNRPIGSSGGEGTLLIGGKK